ncbi:MAG: M14 metallopeptidase family protein [Acidobacteriota bacterium]
MKKKTLLISLAAQLLCAFVWADAKSPSDFLSMPIGADRTLADYHQVSSYLRYLDAQSPRLKVISLGPTTLGEDMIMAVISSEENMRNLPSIQETARKLADPRGLGREETDRLVTSGKTIVLVTCNIHASEIASSQMAMEWAYDLSRATDPKTTGWLENVVLLLVPSLNPDGQIMEVDWYRKYLGTRYEGSSLPWIYHHYVGHDNNRDWFMLTQKETRNLSRAIYHQWFPQIFVDEHQMGSNGPRMFIPPFADPVDSDVNPLIWREVNLIGANMAFRLEQQNKSGLIYGYSFDAYWMGGTRNTGWWKNITGLLLETASARMATPIYIDPTELSGGRKGLVDYKATINHPNPWKGGWWRLRDIMDYERIASDALLEIAATRREDFLRNMLTRANQAVSEASPGDAYRVPAAQRDYPAARRMALLLADHNVNVFTDASTGDYWIPLAQPYGRFVREILEPQQYPEVRLMPGKEILKPYDVATWTLPLMMGVQVQHTTVPPALRLTPVQAPINSDVSQAPPPLADSPFYRMTATSAESAAVVNAALKKGEVRVAEANNAAADTKGTFFLDPAAARAARSTGWRVEITPVPELPSGTRTLKQPRVGVYKSWTAEIDEGWTRFILETNGFDIKSIENNAIRAGNLRTGFDAIILPDMDRDEIMNGKPKREEGQMRYAPDPPPQYMGGIGPEGVKALRDFVENGGTLIALNNSSNLVINEFNIPVRNSLVRAKESDFSVPGSLVRIDIHGNNPITAGMPESLAAFIDSPIAFDTTAPGPEMSRWVLASYPEDASKLLLSGWISGQEKLAGHAAAVAMTYGKGRIVLFGFRPQFRAQTYATFPLLFNSIYWSVQ